jgi:hypothetical protein
MRKLVILLAAAALAAPNAGCCGKLRNWFHKGSPCGTALSPVALGAPLAMSSPVMTSPVMTSAPCQPACCVPCDPCADPCATSVSTGYFGGYMSGGDCGCSDGSGSIVPGTSTAPTSGTVIYPQPGVDN